MEPTSLPTGLQRSSHYFPELESLRGIAIVLVVLHHANALVTRGGDASGTLVSPWWAFIAGGQTGVSLFFVLSGFLLSLPFLREASGGKRVRRADYFKRRAYRILPLYYGAVVVGAVLSASSWTDLLRGVPYLLFLTGPLVTPMQPYNAVWWSLATEVQFYLVLPLLPLCLTTRIGRWAGMMLLAADAIALHLILTARLAPNLPWAIALTHSLLGRGHMFVLGGAAAAIYLRYADRLQSSLRRLPMVQQGGGDVALIALLTALAMLLRWQVYVGYWTMECVYLHYWHVAEALLWTAILLVVLTAPIRMKTLLCNRALGRLGVLSYSIYIVHLPVMHFTWLWLGQRSPGLFVGWTGATVTAVVAMALGCVLAAEITYRVIELPFLRRKALIGSKVRRIGRRRRTRAVPLSVPALAIDDAPSASAM